MVNHWPFTCSFPTQMACCLQASVPSMVSASPHENRRAASQYLHLYSFFFAPLHISTKNNCLTCIIHWKKSHRDHPKLDERQYLPKTLRLLSLFSQSCSWALADKFMHRKALKESIQKVTLNRFHNWSSQGFLGSLTLQRYSKQAGQKESKGLYQSPPVGTSRKHRQH